MNLQPAQCVRRTIGVEIRLHESLLLQCVGLRAVTQHRSDLDVRVVQRLGQQRQRGRDPEDVVRQPFIVGGAGGHGIGHARFEQGHEFAKGQDCEKQVSTSKQFVAGAVVVRLGQIEQSLRSHARRCLAEGRGLQPVSACRPHRVANATTGIVGALKP